MRTEVRIETEELNNECNFGLPVVITDNMMQSIVNPPSNLGVIRLDDGTTIEVPEYDHNAVRYQYFTELANQTFPIGQIAYDDVSDDDIMAWLNGEGQVVDPDHLPYDPKTGF